MARQKRTLKAEDLYRLELIQSPRISPDGQWVVYGLQTADRATEEKPANLWLVPTSSGRARQFTYGEKDSAPAWSPDSKTIAFSSGRGGSGSQIFLINVDGGEARPLTDIKGVIAEFHWSPDGSKFVCTVRKQDAEALARENDPAKKKLGTVVREYSRVFFKADGMGFMPHERWHIWLVDAKTGRTTQITDHDVFDEGGVTWSPDGGSIAYVSNRNTDPDMAPGREDIYIYNLETGKSRKISTSPGGKESLSFSPDGSTIAYYGPDGLDEWYRNTDLWTVNTSGRRGSTNLTAQYDFTVTSGTLNDLGGAECEEPVWSLDGSRINFQIDRHGRTPLMSVGIDGEDLLTEIHGNGCVANYGMDASQTKVMYNFPSMQDPGNLMLLDRKSGKTRQLTRHNTWLNSVDLGSFSEHWITGEDDNPLQGWILRPPGFKSTRKYPTIIEIHGGPLLQYGHYFFHEFHYLAAQGFVVAYSNPRGGQGYGEAHAKAIWGNWGDRDYADVMTWTDFVADQRFVNEKKLGVTGGSYGGYMTCWIIGKSNRFKAAVSQRCVSNFISMWGSSDFNWGFQHLIGNQAPFENVEAAWDQSPMKFIGNAETPTMVIHSEQDLRTPIEQSEQVFVALKRLGVDTEFIRFPDESHGLSRGGRTDRRISRLNHIARWMLRYLK
jgi:dipeptidyl aminopeptidase/acylaminoacyl peptidase